MSKILLWEGYGGQALLMASAIGPGPQGPSRFLNLAPDDFLSNENVEQFSTIVMRASGTRTKGVWAKLSPVKMPVGRQRHFLHARARNAR